MREWVSIVAPPPSCVSHRMGVPIFPDEERYSVDSLLAKGMECKPLP